MSQSCCLESQSPPELIRRLSTTPLSAFALLAGMQLDVFNGLSDEPRTAEELAATLGVRADKLELLLYSLVAVGLLQLRGDRFANDPQAASFLVRGNPSYVGEVADALAEMWAAALKTAESIRSGVPQARIDFASMSEAELESFYRAFYREALTAGRELARSHDFSTSRSLVDVGGGSGGLAIGLTESWPDLRATVADLSGVVPIAERFVAQAGAASRVAVAAADVVAGPLPGSYDVAVLRALIQVLGPDDAQRAIRNVATALEPGGEIFIIGRILEDSRLAPLPAVLSNLVFLNVFDGGRSYTESTYRAWLAEAGFVDIACEIDAEGRGVIRARKPGASA